MAYSGNAAMEETLGPIVQRVASLLAGLDVLELACGTGNWTQVLARQARRVLATDMSEECLSLARTKEFPAGVVTFRAVDAYALGGAGRGFTGAFAADWWSHVPRSLCGAFLDGLHRCLAAGARVVFLDMLPSDHVDLRPYRHDSEGNAICRRTLPDGRAFDVVKNFPGREEVLASLAGRSGEAEHEAWPELGRWLVTYRTPALPSD
jgi:cyclopropane fatty-acyl-phospholipid synthase-like methyltransferase